MLLGINRCMHLAMSIMIKQNGGQKETRKHKFYSLRNHVLSIEALSLERLMSYIAGVGRQVKVRGEVIVEEE